MTREEKKNALHCLKVMIDEEVCEECDLYGTTGTDHCEADCVRVAIQALEQEPKTVLYSGDGYADGYMVYDMAECPNCGYEYEDGDKDWGLSFCPNCGQKLNWERSDHKCHTCKHYTSGQRDGSCGSYICKNYSGWEARNEE